MGAKVVAIAGLICASGALFLPARAGPPAGGSENTTALDICDRGICSFKRQGLYFGGPSPALGVAPRSRGDALSPSKGGPDSLPACPSRATARGQGRGLFRMIHPWAPARAGDFAMVEREAATPKSWKPPYRLRFYCADDYANDDWPAQTMKASVAATATTNLCKERVIFALHPRIIPAELSPIKHGSRPIGQNLGFCPSCRRSPTHLVGQEASSWRTMRKGIHAFVSSARYCAPGTMATGSGGFCSRSRVPLELVELQFRRIAAYLGEGKIHGFSILAACLIDQHPDQAAWVRDFLASR